MTSTLRIRLAGLCAALVVVIASLGSCSPEVARTVLYAPEFKYYERAEVKTTMHRFGASILAIDILLDEEPVNQAELVKQLKIIEEASSELALQGEVSSHPIFDRYLDDLRREVGHARASAEREPPSYLPAAQLIGTCIACHRARRDPQVSLR